MTPIILPLLISLSSFASRENIFVPHWKANCEVGKTKMQLSFDSKSGYADSDDMIVSFIEGGKNQTIIIKEALFEPIKTKNKSICDQLPAIETIDKKILILVGVNNRPTPTNVAAILLDPKDQKIIQVEENLGEIWGQATIKKHSIVVAAIQGWKPNQKSDGPENVIQGKLQIAAKDRRITKTWLTEIKN